jgi:hypothetical protein
MRVLKDGADSVGTLGALNRVYLNIGLFSEEWLLHFRPFLGGQKISPIRIADAERNSVYWQATEAMTPDMAIFFLVAARADHLKDTPVGEKEQAAGAGAGPRRRSGHLRRRRCRPALSRMLGPLLGLGAVGCLQARHGQTRHAKG